MRKQGYRLVYGVQDDIVLVMVLAIDKSEDSAVYQPAITRISEMLSERMKAGPQRH